MSKKKQNLPHTRILLIFAKIFRVIWNLYRF